MGGGWHWILDPPTPPNKTAELLSKQCLAGAVDVGKKMMGQTMYAPAARILF